MKQFSNISDDDIDVAALGLAVAQNGDQDDLSFSIDDLTRAKDYLKTLGARVRARRHDLVMSGADDDARTDLAALKYILVDTDGFKGADGAYEDLLNANLVHVINRRCGLPVALAILYVHAAGGADITVRALDFPGHVVMRVERGGQIIMFDPSDVCATLDAADLRAILKRGVGPDAELNAAYYTPLSRRGMIIRLQNNIKLRLVERMDYRGALHVLEGMRAIDPGEYRILFDLGVLYEKLDDPTSAIVCLTDYLAALPARHPNRRVAADLLITIQSKI